jgi:hypothetical protein
MDHSPSLRFIRAGPRIFIVGLVMFVAAVVTGVAGGPKDPVRDLFDLGVKG